MLCVSQLPGYVQMELASVPTFLAIASVLMITSALAYEFGRTRFVRLIKRRRKELWLALGKPSRYFISYLIGRDDLEKYLFEEGYEQSGDGGIRYHGKRLKVFLVLHVLSAGLFMMTLLVELLMFR
jgi:hypothetical protein